ncbi:uncharacterized protein LOC116656777 [Camelus ferus]|uniref:Uncharacterized protein LOC116656777 n=1 Tax=Camelus ferus TaxID=419612 RepID=A0A8B8R5E8_CAMFR|nr:uncharacterized protein LOC116656777 [Camelus ferus]
MFLRNHSNCSTAAPCFIPTSSAPRFWLLHVLANTFIFWFLFFIAMLVGGKQCLTVVLSCMSLLMNDVEHLFMCFFGHLCIFFGEMPVQVLCPFLSWVACLLLFGCRRPLNILDTRPLSETLFPPLNGLGALVGSQLAAETCGFLSGLGPVQLVCVPGLCQRRAARWLWLCVSLEFLGFWYRIGKNSRNKRRDREGNHLCSNSRSRPDWRTRSADWKGPPRTQSNGGEGPDAEHGREASGHWGAEDPEKLSGVVGRRSSQGVRGTGRASDLSVQPWRLRGQAARPGIICKDERRPTSRAQAHLP